MSSARPILSAPSRRCRPGHDNGGAAAALGRRPLAECLFFGPGSKSFQHVLSVGKISACRRGVEAPADRIKHGEGFGRTILGVPDIGQGQRGAQLKHQCACLLRMFRRPQEVQLGAQKIPFPPLQNSAHRPNSLSTRNQW